jgi:GAF domain-containing protein
MSPANAEMEKRRLEILWQYEVLDTIPEQLFDDLTELAAVICEAPIALISMVDEHRQWFKSRFGTTLEETSRDVSFCAYAITQPDLFIIPDATQDERFANNPLVTSDPKIRFYAGAPLITPDGYALGTLCVIDKVPRELRPDQKQALRILARHAVLQLELRRRTQDVRSGRARMTDAPSPGADEEIARLKRELAKARRDLRRQPSKKKNRPKTAKKPIRPRSRRKPAPNKR